MIPSTQERDRQCAGCTLPRDIPSFSDFGGPSGRPISGPDRALAAPRLQCDAPAGAAAPPIADSAWRTADQAATLRSRAPRATLRCSGNSASSVIDP
jgi:hypothetical protein